MVKRLNKPLLQHQDTSLREHSLGDDRDPAQPSCRSILCRIASNLSRAAQAEAPIGDRWAFEVKWDGYRIAVHLDHGKVRTS